MGLSWHDNKLTWTTEASSVVKPDEWGLKDIFDRYESGKGRRYNLLFAVNGGAFAMVSFLLKDPKPQDPTGPFLAAMAAGMVFFTALMFADIYSFGLKMKELGGPLKLFGTIGKVVLACLATLLIVAWMTLGIWAWLKVDG